MKRYKVIKRIKTLNPEKTAKDLWQMCMNHLKQSDGEYDLYRIFYYDCLPYSRKQHNPITGKSVDFSKTEKYRFQHDFYKFLRQKRKVALRLGVLEDRNRWILRPEKTKELLASKISIKDLTENDVVYDLMQKMVDI